MIVAFSSSAPAAPKIGVFFDPEGNTCSRQIHQGDTGTMYVLAFLDMGPAASEIMGTEFSITGFPPNGLAFSAQYNAPSQGTTLGSPLGGAAAIAFSPCRSGTRIVQLGTITYSSFLGDPPSFTIRVEAGDSNDHWTCPVIVLCEKPSRCNGEVPNFPRLCAEGLQSVVNGSCTVDAGEHVLEGRLSAWPNPAHGSTNLRFALPRESELQLQIYDLAGRLVRQIATRAPAGPQMMRWDGRDRSGRPVASGIYFVRLRGAGTSLQCRLTQLR
jgi:hypothetical protein